MWGFDLFDAGLVSAMGIALFGGMLSFLSPCVLPIVPPYLAYMGGITMREAESPDFKRTSMVLASCFFVLGLSTVFLFLGFTASTLGRWFLGSQEWFTIIAGALIVVFGLSFLGVFRLPLLQRDLRLSAGDLGGKGGLGAYVLGLAFAFGWTPCIGPILGAVLSMAADTSSPGRGLTLMAFYAAGLGIPFILFAVFLPSLGGVMAFMKRHMRAIERTMGVFLSVVGLTMMTGQFTAFSWWLLEQFPALGTLG